jgi:DNA-binding CsgD family transcriptional regulator
LLIGGEAGIGKSRLLDELTTRAGGRIAHAESFAEDRQTPGLLLLGIAAGLRDEAGGGGSAARIHDLVVAGARERGPVGRRLLVADVVDAVVTALRVPLLLRLEDLQWSDQLTLDVLQRVAVSLPTLPSLVVGTYRSQEPDAEPGFTAWRLGLLARRHAEEVLLPRLGRDGTRRMLASIEGQEPAEDEVERMFAAADGIPLHVEELYAVGPGEVPDTVGEAVLARARKLSPAAAGAMGAAAVIGREFDRPLLAVVLDEEGDSDAVDDALDELIAQHFVVRAGENFDFRHALIRDAVYAALPAAERRSMHARVATGASRLSDGILSVHSERAGRADEAYVRARRAADRASSLSAHREAVDLYRRAERTVPAGTPATERAELHRRLGSELAAVDANRESEREFVRAIELFREAGDTVAAAAVVPALAAARHLLGVDYETRAALIIAAIGWLPQAGHDDTADVGAGREADHQRGRLLAALAAAAMLDRRLDSALGYASEARSLLDDDQDERLAVDVTRGAVLVFAGDDAGWDLMSSSAAEAARSHREPVAARAYRMLGSSASVLLQYRRGTSWLQQGIDYATRIESWNDAHYLLAHLAHVHWATGDLRQAQQLASRALADGRGGITTEITALHVLGYTALARGDVVKARAELSRAAELGERMHELQRLSPALWGLAETALASGDAVGAAELSERGMRESSAVGDAAYLFPFVVTGMRALLAAGELTRAREWLDEARELLAARGIRGTQTAVTHAAGLLALRERRLTAAKELLTSAADGWAALDRWWEGTRALLDRAEASRRTRGPAEAAELVERARTAAVAAGAELLVGLADEVAGRLAEGVAPTTLSAREEEVARLVATGATNRAIGEVLHIAPKTVATHIEHILGKLGASRRAEIAAWAAASSPVPPPRA